MSEDFENVIALDRNTPVPLHYQLQQAIRNAIEEGILKPDDRLPPIHVFAKQQGLSVSTVARAFTDLSREGLIVSSRGTGTRVAVRTKSTTDFVMTWRFESMADEKRAYFYRIVEGLREGFDDPDRRLVFSHYDEESISERELMAVCRARGVDSLVVYRPHRAMMDAVRSVSLQIPTVSLFTPVADSAVDSVICDPKPAMKKVVGDYLKMGYRKFVYLGISIFIDHSDPGSPHKTIHDEFIRLMKKAGIEPDVRIIRKGGDAESEKAEARVIAAKVSSDSVLVTVTPDLAADAKKDGCRGQFITYTECEPSYREIKGYANVIFCELDEIGLKAAGLIKERITSGRRASRVDVVEAPLRRPAH